MEIPQRLRKHPFGIISDKGMVKYNKESKKLQFIPHSNTFTHVGEIADMARVNGVANLWVAPFTSVSQQCLNDVFITSATEYLHRDYNPDFSNFLNLYKTGVGTYEESNSVYVTIPENTNSQWALPESIKPSEMYKTIELVSHQLPVDIQASPSRSGKNTIRKLLCTDERLHWLDQCEYEPDNRQGIGDLIFLRQAPFEDKLYLHAYDRNSAYGASMVGLKVGEGSPVHHTDIHTFDKHLTGVWKIKNICGETPYNDVILPAPHHQHTKWVWTPTAVSMIDCGYSFDIEECYIWHTSHTTLSDFATKLWSARTAIEASQPSDYSIAHDYAIAWCKQMLVATNGIFSVKYETSDDLFRRDFYFLVKASNRLRVLLVIRKLAEIGYFPIAVNNDAIYYLSDNPSPYEAIPHITRLADKLGGYKVKGTVKWSDIKADFYSNSHIQFTTAFNKLAENYTA